MCSACGECACTSHASPAIRLHVLCVFLFICKFIQPFRPHGRRRLRGHQRAMASFHRFNPSALAPARLSKSCSCAAHCFGWRTHATPFFSCSIVRPFQRGELSHDTHRRQFHHWTVHGQHHSTTWILSSHTTRPIHTSSKRTHDIVVCSASHLTARAVRLVRVEPNRIRFTRGGKENL